MKYIKLSLVVIWMIVIFLFSNQKAVESTKLSDGFILKTVRLIEEITNKKYSDEEILNKFVKPVRKFAHFIIYFILGMLVYNYIRIYGYKNTFLISLFICIGYACIDEIHQIFVDGRSGELLDVINDSMGSLIGIFLFKKNTGNK